MASNNATLQKQESHEVARPEATRGIYYTPRVDIFETEDELVFFADVPGTRPDTVDIKYENGELTVHARCKPRQTETNYVLCEYGVGDFYRVFTLDDSINPDRIGAELKNGVLTVHLPKAESVKPKKITVKGE
jgi:HSP20 family protein